MTTRQWLLLAAILLVAAGTRLYRLDLPGGIWMDEALNGLQGIHAVRAHDWRVFYPENNGREGLWVDLTGVSEAVFGVNAFGLRVPEALSGILTVLCLFFLLRRLFSARVGFIAAWLAAIGFWFVHFSRVLHATGTPLAITASLLLLIMALDATAARWQIALAIAAGAVFGFGFHTYLAFRAAPLLAAAFFSLELRRSQAVQRTNRVFGIAGFIALVVAVPLLRYFVAHPEFLFERAQQVSVFANPHPVRALAYSAVHTIVMFNWRGDTNWRHNLSGAPQLLWPIGIAFLGGVLMALHAAWRRKWQARGELLLLLWLVVMMLPAILAVEGVPHAMRTLGAAPAVYGLAALGYEWFLDRFSKPAVIHAIAFVLVAIPPCGDVARYFGFWANNQQLVMHDAFSQRATAIGEYLKTLPPGSPVVIVIPASPLPSYADSPKPVPDIRVQPIEFANYGGTLPVYVYFHDLIQSPSLLKRGTKVICAAPMDLELLVKPLGIRVRHEGHSFFMVDTVE